MKKKFYTKFDKATKTKLHIFIEYFKESFPVFLHTKGWNKILIFDFFAGQGKDEEGEFGTALSILDSISQYCHKIISERKQVHIILNDAKESDTLKTNVKDFIERCKKQCDIKKCLLDSEDTLLIRNRNFKEYFQSIYPDLSGRYRNMPKLIFLDPFGFVMDNQIFLDIINLPKTDFICFFPSSFLRRFKDHPSFKSYIDINQLNFEESEPRHCHRVIANYFESLIPDHREYYLSYFSIKKSRNYYGLIFGSNHSFGAEKFQKICWKADDITGEANYNIDRELTYNGDVLFDEMREVKKISDFKKHLKLKIMKKEIKSKITVYKYTLKNRCMLDHANEVLKELIKNQKIKKLKIIKSAIHNKKDEEIILL